MKDLKNILIDIEEKATKLEEKSSEPIMSVIKFIKSHQRLLISIGIIYLIGRFIFDED